MLTASGDNRTDSSDPSREMMRQIAAGGRSICLCDRFAVVRNDEDRQIP